MKLLIIFQIFLVFSRVLKPREIQDGSELLLPIVSTTVSTTIVSTTASTATSSMTTFTGQATVIELRPFEISTSNKTCDETEFRTKPFFGNFMLTSEPPSLCPSTETPTQSTPVKEFHVTDMIRTTMTEPLPPWAPRPWGNIPIFPENFTSPCHFFRDGVEIDLPCDWLRLDINHFSDYQDHYSATPPCEIVHNGDVVEIPCEFSGGFLDQFSDYFLSNFPNDLIWPSNNDSVIIEHLPPMTPPRGVQRPPAHFPGVDFVGEATLHPPIELSYMEPTWIKANVSSIKPLIESTTEVKNNGTLIIANDRNNSTSTESSTLNSTIGANEEGPKIPLDSVSTENQQLATQPLSTNEGTKPKFAMKFILCFLIIYFQ